MKDIKERFLSYVAFDTQSDENSTATPSTHKQIKLLEFLKEELSQMGIAASLDKFGYVMAKIPSNSRKNIPAIGFIAHVDTSPDASGSSIKPQTISNYNGQDITLPGSGDVLSPTEYPELLIYKGNDIITTDGTTLLGADDKAGIAEIMAAAEYIMEHPEFEHGDICIGFTPDEEIGRGVDNFNVEGFGAQYAYTMDGGAIGELEYENFNAASATVNFYGLNIHPGYAKGRMKNAMRMAMEFDSMIPSGCRPESTEGYEGFFHLTGMHGSVEQASLTYIIRDHNKSLFERKKEIMQENSRIITEKYGKGCITLEIKDQYFNMRSQLEHHMDIVNIAHKAMEMEDIVPVVKPIRGGTDGARLSFMGLPCPNIFAGGHNFHSRKEFLPVQSMEKAAKVIINIISLYCRQN